jgi:Protein of unknown function (DUF3800)
LGRGSFSGAPLQGTKLVRIVYIDEAGLSKASEEPYLVVAGVLVHGDNQLSGVENYLDRLMRRHIPAEHHENFVFSAKHLFNGDNKVFKRNDPNWPLKRRLEVADDLAAITEKFKLPIALGWIERSTFRDVMKFPIELTDSERLIAQHSTANMNCAMMAQHWMRRNARNEICMLVVENNDLAKKFISDIQRFHQDKKFAETLSPEARKHFPLRKIKEDPLFQPKKQSHPLIIADFCYVWKRILMGDKKYDRFFNPFRKRVIYFDDMVEAAEAKLSQSSA